MKEKVMKETYELPRIAIRGIVVVEEMAASGDILVGTITQDDWTGSAEETVTGGNITLMY
jgi:hypothetical protein